MAQAAAQLNSFAGKIEYVDIQLYALRKDFLGDGGKLTTSAHTLYGLFKNFATKRDEQSEHGSASFSYVALHRITGKALSTISAAIKALTGSGVIRQDKSNRSHTRYEILKDEEKGGYIRVDSALFPMLEDKFGKLHFSVKEKWIFFLMLGLSKKIGEDYVYEGSQQKIANVVKASSETVRRTLKKLVKKGLFHCPDYCKGKSKKKSSKYIVDTDLRLIYQKLVARRKEEAKARAKEKTKEKAPADQKPDKVKALDERAEREHYYAVLHQRAQERADSFAARMERDDAYLRADRELRKIEIELVKAELYRPAEVAKLQEQQKTLQAVRAHRMALYGITEADLHPLWHCKLCEDTGYKKDGTACTCYSPGSSP